MPVYKVELTKEQITQIIELIESNEDWLSQQHSGTEDNPTVVGYIVANRMLNASLREELSRLLPSD